MPKLTDWADCHVFYNLYDHPSTTENMLLQNEKTYWRQYFRDGTPNGDLILHNSMFDALQNEVIYLLHVTSEKKLKKLVDVGEIYPSGGCLVGAIYCSPLYKEGEDAFRLHNLGEYIFTEEAPRALARQSRADAEDVPVPIIVEVGLPPRARNNLIGVDYLRMGEMHLTIYQELEYLLSPTERFDLGEAILHRVRNSVDFLSLCSQILYHDTKVDARKFMELCRKAINHLPIMGYFLFEAVTEYLFLHQTSARSQEYKDRGEFFNWPYKQMIFSLYPKLSDRFDLSKFNPSVEDIVNFFESSGDFKIDERHFGEYLKKRLAFLVNARLLRSASSEIDWRGIEWRFYPATKLFGALMGHLIHRELRSFQRYPSFYYYYDLSKALHAWNYWNHHDIALPFNGGIPKGEIGINPAYSQSKLAFFRGVFDEKTKCLKRDKKLVLEASPKLVELRYSFMRKPDQASSERRKQV